MRTSHWDSLPRKVIVYLKYGRHSLRGNGWRLFRRHKRRAAVSVYEGVARSKIDDSKEVERCRSSKQPAVETARHLQTDWECRPVRNIGRPLTSNHRRNPPHRS